MSLWKRLFGSKPAEPPAEPAPEPAVPAAPAALSVTAQAEGWLSDAVGALVASAAPPDPDALWGHISALRTDGHDRLALEWLDKLAGALADGELRDEIRLRACELRADRGELRDALAHLEALTARPPYAARAHFLIAEHHRREGDLRAALRHLEAVLAIDLRFPNAHVRAQAIRAQLGASASAPAAGGDTIAGPEGGSLRTARYQLVRHLGRGAAGAVYLAKDVELARQVAVKLLHPHLSAATQAAARARFFDEARVAAALRHPGIIAVLDLDEAQKRIVMEYAAGGTLRERLAAGPLAPLAALERHAELLAALAAAHARGVVHRDLKPANLLFRRSDADAELVLTDFGVAHLAGADRRGEDRQPVGTLAYMAPEQRRAETATPAADVYAAGVILWECLHGRLPWANEALLAGRRADADLALTAATRALLGGAADAVDAHLRALGAIDPLRRSDTGAALVAANGLIERLRHGAELDRLGQELERFRADLA